MTAAAPAHQTLSAVPCSAVRTHQKPLEKLCRVRQAGVNLAIWPRSPNPDCTAAIDALLIVPHPAGLDIVPRAITDLQEGIFSLVGGCCDERSARALADDIWLLVRLFCEIADISSARVRVERIEDNGCQLFHADSLRIRMLCTYAGPGTEWLTEDNVRFDQLGLQGRSVEEANRAIVVNEGRIQRVQPWHVAVFTGSQRGDALPLVHRSGPVRSKADHRIRLCIDSPEACGC